MADRRFLGLWFRTGASLLMLAILLPKVDIDSLLPRWDRAAVLWLLGALLLTAAGIVMSALRWEAVLLGLGQHERARRLLHHYLAGLFIGNFLPSTIGGDVLRAKRLSDDNGEPAITFASVVLERLTGMLVLPVITLVALLANPGLRDLGSASAVAIGLSAVTLVLLGTLLWGVSHPRLASRFAGDSRWQRFASAVHLGAARFRERPAAVGGVLITAFGYQLLVVGAAFCAARAIDLDHVGLTAILAFVPAVAIVQVLPISLGGLGAREVALVFFLRPLDVPTGRAVALGLLLYGLNLIVSLVGAPSFAVGGKRPASTEVPA